ncbi:MAG: hypothetical protein P1U56_07060 [Saprospiraceae bacterium]|nr:hypothetical protein [Saprospiraceae bacterium]
MIDLIELKSIECPDDLTIIVQSLKVEINKVNVQNNNSYWIHFLGILVVILGAIIFLPLFILALVAIGLYNLIFKINSKEESNSWINVEENGALSIQYKWIFAEDQPDYLSGYFEESSVLIFKSQPHINFFEGYFTDFKIERKDGLFLQKIVVNNRCDTIIALPLYFFQYESQEIKEIIDLEGYEIDVRGGAEDFLILAEGKEDKLEIHIKV